MAPTYLQFWNWFDTVIFVSLAAKFLLAGLFWCTKAIEERTFLTKLTFTLLMAIMVLDAAFGVASILEYKQLQERKLRSSFFLTTSRYDEWMLAAIIFAFIGVANAVGTIV